MKSSKPQFDGKKVKVKLADVCTLTMGQSPLQIAITKSVMEFLSSKEMQISAKRLLYPSLVY